MMLNHRLIIVILSLSVLLSGCGGSLLGAPEAASKTYVLNATIEPVETNRLNKVLLVDEPKSQPGFDTPYIAYTRGPLELDYYTKSEWADTPARMLTPLVVQALEASDGFQAVVVPPTPAEGDLRLELDIIRLQQEFIDTPSESRLTIRAKLFDVNRRNVLATRVFEVRKPAPSEDAYGGVQAANAAVGDFLQQLVEFVLEQRR